MAAKYIKISDSDFINIRGADEICVRERNERVSLLATRESFRTHANSNGRAAGGCQESLVLMKIDFTDRGGWETAHKALSLIMDSKDEVFDMVFFLKAHPVK